MRFPRLITGYLLLGLMVTPIQSLFAQSEEATKEHSERFSLGLGIGYAKSLGTGAEGGLVFSAEPRLAIGKVMSIGFRFQTARLTRGIQNMVIPYEQAPVDSYLLTADFRSSDASKVKPVIGFGTGVYALDDIRSEFGSREYVHTQSTNEFGFMVRGGVALWHLVLAAEYNFIPRVWDRAFIDFDFVNIETRSSYLGVSIAYVISF